MKLFDAAKNSVAGKWEAHDGMLASDGTDYSRIEFSYRPGAEYDYRIVFTRASGNNSINMLCCGAGHQFETNIGSWDNAVIGFGLIGGKEVKKYHNSTYIGGMGTERSTATR